MQADRRARQAGTAGGAVGGRWKSLIAGVPVYNVSLLDRGRKGGRPLFGLPFRDSSSVYGDAGDAGDATGTTDHAHKPTRTPRSQDAQSGILDDRRPHCK